MQQPYHRRVKVRVLRKATRALHSPWSLHAEQKWNGKVKQVQTCSVLRAMLHSARVLHPAIKLQLHESICSLHYHGSSAPGVQ